MKKIFKNLFKDVFEKIVFGSIVLLCGCMVWAIAMEIDSQEWIHIGAFTGAIIVSWLIGHFYYLFSSKNK